MKRLVLSLTVISGLATASFATVLVPGTFVTPAGMNYNANPTLDGAILQDSTFGVTGMNALSQVVFTGILEAAIIRESTGTLDFYYRFQNDAGSQDDVERLTATNFAGYSTDVYYINDLGGDVPYRATRSAGGDTVGFNFDGILPGSSSAYCLIRTNAVNYAAGTTSLINGGVGSVQTWAPVPEPASLSFFALSALGLLRRRSKK